MSRADSCQICGKPVNRKGAKYCSYTCAGLARQHYKTCVICGNRFASPPANDVSTCGRNCSASLRRRQAMELDYTDRLDAARQEYIRTVAPEDWQTAKIWEICSPGGTIYRCKNLIEFFRQHADLIDGTPRQAAKGIASVKRSMIGSRKKNPCFHWKGWTLISWDDCGISPRK